MTSLEALADETSPLFTELEVVDDRRAYGAAFNMAMDESLLENSAKTPLLRLYTWAQPAVSFGYFEPYPMIEAMCAGRDAVRRWTGGGTVEHGRDFTYSLLIPSAHDWSVLRAEESYRRVHGAVAAALVAAGCSASDLHSARESDRELGTPGPCFVRPVRHDLLIANRKVAGAAQRRTRKGWLHQGSILLPDPTRAIYERLTMTLPRALGAKTYCRVSTPAENSLAHRLEQAKYGSLAWLCRF